MPHSKRSLLNVSLYDYSPNSIPDLRITLLALQHLLSSAASPACTNNNLDSGHWTLTEHLRRLDSDRRWPQPPRLFVAGSASI